MTSTPFVKCMILATVLLWPGPLLNAASARSTSPKLVSPDSVYSAEIQNPNANTNDLARILVIKKKSRPILRVSTEGYITDAYWSPDGKYVAVNNRNAQSGDYVWVFSLNDGAVIKKPFDNLPTGSAPEKFPQYDNYEVHDQWILAMGWNASDELHIRIDTIYSNVSDYLCDDLTYSIKKDKLSLVSHTETKKPRPQ